MRIAVHIVSHVRAGNPDLQRVEHAGSFTSQFAWEQVIQISESVKSGFPARRYRAAESGDSVLTAARAITIARTVVSIAMATRLHARLLEFTLSFGSRLMLCCAIDVAFALSVTITVRPPRSVPVTRVRKHKSGTPGFHALRVRPGGEALPTHKPVC